MVAAVTKLRLGHRRHMALYLMPGGEARLGAVRLGGDMADRLVLGGNVTRDSVMPGLLMMAGARGFGGGDEQESGSKDRAKECDTDTEAPCSTLS
jgi:hypothetical protein